jgi:LPS export ABC transporter protein LptC
VIKKYLLIIFGAIEKTMALFFLMRLSFLVLVLIVVSSCSKTELKEPVEYTGPISEAENVELFYSEKDIVKVKMVTPLMHEFKNQDRECPKGIYLEFFDENGKLESTLKANHAYYFKEENQWRGRGDVIVKNIQKKEQLNTEELFWKQADKKIFTDKFVTIRLQDDVIYGEGLDAKEDLSDYTINKISGSFEVKE